MTVFDPHALSRIASDTDSDVFVLDLVRTYRRLLAARVERVFAGLASGDVDETMDAVLSLRVSSAMTGAVDLAGLAQRIEDDVRRGDLAHARQEASALLPAVAEVESALRSWTEHHVGESPAGDSDDEAQTDSIR
jgi:HPt (histidine-containing phosphotransfer) domain-containing protein